ncbi:hypothetical protein BVRB_5g114500 [Beta vulgaris subsp. vulgaris]|nr:hypothetical protein BVRB_5g114500 [Beta vulgaris subsp. vulgaris]
MSFNYTLCSCKIVSKEPERTQKVSVVISFVLLLITGLELNNSTRFLYRIPNMHVEN